MAVTQHDADIINEDRRIQATMMRERLERMGVIYRVATFTGDSSYPTEYTLSYGTIQGVGPTFDLALAEFVEKLLTSEKAQAFQAMETALQVLTGNILNLRTEVLVVKALVARESEDEEEPPDLVAEQLHRIESPGYNELGEDEPYYVAPEQDEE